MARTSPTRVAGQSQAAIAGVLLGAIERELSSGTWAVGHSEDSGGGGAVGRIGVNGGGGGLRRRHGADPVVEYGGANQSDEVHLRLDHIVDTTVICHVDNVGKRGEAGGDEGEGGGGAILCSANEDTSHFEAGGAGALGAMASHVPGRSTPEPVIFAGLLVTRSAAVATAATLSGAASLHLIGPKLGRS